MHLHFFLCLPYRAKPSGSGILPNEPSLPIELAGPQLSLQTHLCLDSGSERTVVHGKLASMLGFDLHKGNEVLITTAGRDQRTAHLHTVTVRVDPDPASIPEDTDRAALSVDLEIAFTTWDIPRSVLGRDFFDSFLVALDELQGLIYLGPPGQSPAE